jgi:hypothetical protein
LSSWLTRGASITHPSKASWATPAGCARAHPPDSPSKNKNESKGTYSLSLSNLRRSAPLLHKLGGYCRVSKYPGYLTGDKLRHPARVLKNPTIRDPKHTNSMSAVQNTNDKLYLARALRRGLGHDRTSWATSLRLARALRRHRKRSTPAVHFRFARGARGTLRQGGEPRAPNTVLAPSM